MTDKRTKAELLRLVKSREHEIDVVTRTRAENRKQINVQILTISDLTQERDVARKAHDSLLRDARELCSCWWRASKHGLIYESVMREVQAVAVRPDRLEQRLIDIVLLAAGHKEIAKERASIDKKDIIHNMQLEFFDDRKPFGTDQ